MPPIVQAAFDNAGQIAAWMFQGLITLLLAMVVYQGKEVIQRVDANTLAAQENMRAIVKNEGRIEAIKSFSDWIMSDLNEIKNDVKKIEERIR